MLTGPIIALTGRYHLALLALASLVALRAWPAGASGIALGGGVMAANFAGARWLGSRALRPGRGRAAYVLAMALKLVALLGVIAAIMVTLRPHLLAFALGMASFFCGLPCAIVHAGLRRPRLQAR